MRGTRTVRERVAVLSFAVATIALAAACGSAPQRETATLHAAAPPSESALGAHTYVLPGPVSLAAPGATDIAALPRDAALQKYVSTLPPDSTVRSFDLVRYTNTELGQTYNGLSNRLGYFVVTDFYSDLSTHHGPAGATPLRGFQKMTAYLLLDPSTDAEIFSTVLPYGATMSTDGTVSNTPPQIVAALPSS